MIELTERPIDVDGVLEQVRSPHAGAVVLFLGTARQFTGGRETRALDYECYRPMALKQLQKLESEVRQRWTLHDVCLIHRIGHLELGEASVAIAVSAPHRDAAFDAGRWLIDTLKQSVPIWKKESWADGATEWVHPGVTLPAPEGDK